MSDQEGNQIKHKNKALAGLTIILLGLLLNKWVIERFASDGIIESPSYIAQILVVQILLIFSGIYLITNSTVLKRACIVIIFLVPFITFSMVNLGGVRFLNRKSDTIPSGKSKPTENTAQVMLERAISLGENKIADLSLETGEILYSPNQTEFPLTFKVPEGGILNTAIGIDPLIRNLFTGNVYFKVSIARFNGNQHTIFKDVIDLSSLTEKDFMWRNVSVSLSEYAGSEITLKFSKGYNDSQKKPEVIYDLLPTEFMYWRTPNVRPEKLAGKLNVILVSLDTLRADHLHYMGYPRETSSNLDRLTQNGTFFTTAVSQAPWTTPSHFSIFTSTYPSVNKGNQTIQTKGRHWNGKLPTMADILREKGYVTAAFTGKGSISAKFGFYRGFDFYNETSSFTGEGFEGEHKGDVEEIFNKAMRWLNNNKHRSFFLFIHTYEPHAPYSGEYFVKKEGINESEGLKHMTALYDGDIRRTDLFVGKLISKLNELGLMDNTIVVITSDHGEDLGGRNPPEAFMQSGHGHSLYDELLRVPLIFYNQRIFPRGRGIDYQVRLIDILPTVLDYLGYAQERSFQGKSLRAMIEGNDQLSRPAYSEATTYGTERESMRADGYKYIHRISYGELSHRDSKGMLLTPLHELYDLNADPG